MTQEEPLIPRLLEVPKHLAIAQKPKIIDFTEINMYPSKYKYVDNKVIIKSLIIEDVLKQKEALHKVNATILINDRIKVDFKFGHLENGAWIDLYVKGLFRIKRFQLLKTTNEILILVGDG